MTEHDVRKIEEYVSTLPRPDPDDSKTIFEFKTYSLWAAEEILERVINEASLLPSHISGKDSLTLTEVVENFVREMDYYVEISRREEPREIFAVARDEAKCLMLYISNERGK